MTCKQHRANSSSVSEDCEAPLTFVRCVDKLELKEMITAYKSRTFDEDIMGVDSKQGKSRSVVSVHEAGGPHICITEQSLTTCAINSCLGVEEISNKLKTHLTKGLNGGDFPARKEHFGDNFRPPLVAKSFCKIFWEALDDFMLKVLLVAATGSLIFEYIGADPDHYSTGK